MAPPAHPRWRRRLVLGGVAAAIVLAHGWGLSTVGQAASAVPDASARPAPFTVRSVALEAAPAALATAPLSLAMPVATAPRAVEVARPRKPAETVPEADPASPPEDAPPSDADRSADTPADAVADPAGAAEHADAGVPPESSDSPPNDPPPAEPEPEPADATLLLAEASPKKPAPAARPEAVEVPVYATRLAAAFSARYKLQRGLLGGTGTLRWAPSADGSRYEAKLDGSVAGFNVLDWTSSGAIDRAGIAPERFLMRRRGKEAQAANFQRAAGKITYSGPSVQYDLPTGAQDRLSWMLQIGGVLNAAPKRFSVGSRISFFVSGARGDADVWQFSVAGLESVPAGGGRETMALKLVREPRKPYDTRVEVWLDPAREHRPVLARLATNGNDDALELRLAD